MEKINESIAQGLYRDKDLDRPLTSKMVETYFNGMRTVPFYFYDGNNGDRHLLVGWTTDWNGNIETVIGVNLYQCHALKSGFGDYYQNASQLAEGVNDTEMDVPKLIRLFNSVSVFNWK